MIWRLIITLVSGYLLGNLNGALMISTHVYGDDVRNHGSGNAGMTNFLRVFGKKLAPLVIGTDVLKAVFALLLGMLGARLLAQGDHDIITPLQAKYLSGLCCELGHMFPVTFGFKGGKGVLSGGTIAIMISWKVAVVVWGSFLILALLTKYVSLGSVSTGILYPIMAWVLYRDLLILICAILTGGLLVWAHRGNIKRLLTGQESKFSVHKNT